MQVRDGELLGRMIATQQYSLRTFAEKLGWKSHSYLQRLIAGQVRTVKPEAGVLISHILGVPADVLFVTKASTDPVHDDDSGRTRRAS